MLKSSLSTANLVADIVTEVDAHRRHCSTANSKESNL